MKKITPILILLIIVGVVSVSGCIHYVDSDNNPQDNIILDNSTPSDTTQNDEVIENVNKSGNIKIGDKSDSDSIKKNNQEKTSNIEPKISKSEIEKEIIRIMKLDDDVLNYTANATLIYIDKKPVYIVDVFNDYGWYAYFEVDADNGPEGNDEEGYYFLGGAVMGETGDEPVPIQGVMPELSMNQAREIMDDELDKNYSIENVSYTINGYLNESNPYYNITIEKYDEISEENYEIGSAYMNANTGEIIYLNITSNDEKANTNNNNNNNNNNKNNGGSEKIYSADEAGDYIDIEYNGKTVGVREKYPYYSPQNDKVYYSQKEEAEDLYQMSLDIEN